MADGDKSSCLYPCEAANGVANEGNKDGKDDNSVKKVSDWVRRSVLFWNKQDTISIDESSDVQEIDHESDGIISEELPRKNSDSKPDNSNNVDDDDKIRENLETESLLLVGVEKIHKLCEELESGETEEDIVESRRLMEKDIFTLSNTDDLKRENSYEDQKLVEGLSVIENLLLDVEKIERNSRHFETRNLEDNNESSQLLLENCSWKNNNEIKNGNCDNEKLNEKSATEDLILEVEKTQKNFIDPFIMGTADDVFGSNLSNDSPYYTLNFPKYSRHMYSPLYEKNPFLFGNNGGTSPNKLDDCNIADTLNKLNQTWDEVESNSYNKAKDQKGPGEPLNRDANCDKNRDKIDTKQRNYDFDVLNSIKKVQETLGEIAAELENTRTRKTSRNRDPNVILINLLSRIEPPVNRDSFASSLVDENSQSVAHKTTDPAQTRIGEKSGCPSSAPPAGMASGSNGNKGNCEEFDVLKELSDPQKSTETVLEQFMEKLSATEKPSSAIRGLLRRISEEITGEGAIDESSHHEASINQGKLGAGLEVRRVSSVSTQSSIPTSPNTINYDSGFSEHPKTTPVSTKDLFTSILPDDTKHLKLVKESLDESKNDRDSETSTDWSPYSTLSVGENPFKVPRSSAFQAASSRRTSGRRRSTGTVNSRPTSSKMTGTGAGSCPSFEGNCPSPAVAAGIRYSRTEVEAIRKFLSLTSIYFGPRAPGNEMGNLAYEELMEKGDIEKIHEILQNQREDLEKQRHQQETLLQRLGEMLLQLVTLKEDHMTSTQKQTKALTLLKKQLDLQRKEQSKSHESVKEQMKTLEEQLQSQIALIQEQSTSGSLPAIVTVDTPNVGQSANDEISKGHIIWKVSGITRKLTRIHAGSSEGVLVSESFYSGPFGYKMAAWLYLNGRGDYRGKGMSIYVCPLSGEYDAILHWPVRPVFTFTLVDQNPDTTKRHDHTKVRRTPEIAKKGESVFSTKGGIPRPQNGAKSFIIGFDDFISQNELSQGTYILDDVLFLRVEAEIKH